MRIEVLTTFPQMIEAAASESVIGRAREKGIVEIEAVDLRDFTADRHRSTDDEPFGGGPGMVMKCEPVFAAVEALAARRRGERPRIVLMTPQGRRFDQKLAEELAADNYIVLICGRYEGIDERIREHLANDEISIGDYVLTGGEIPALVVMDAVARLVPGVLGDETSIRSESFASGVLEYPQYTRPAEFRGYKVPEVLLSGDHERIKVWRRAAALERTLARRPDLIETAPLTGEDLRLLEEIKKARTPPQPSPVRRGGKAPSSQKGVRGRS